jgi:hypothetical protein
MQSKFKWGLFKKLLLSEMTEAFGFAQTCLFCQDSIKKLLTEQVSLYTCIRELGGSNFDRDTGYPGCGFSWFSSVPQGKCRESISMRPRPLPSKSLSMHHSLIPLSPHAIWSQQRQPHYVPPPQINYGERTCVVGHLGIHARSVYVSLFYF